jgi:hypothetical protein
MTSSVVGIGNESLAEEPDRLGVAPGFLRHQTQQVQALDMRWRGRQGVLAQLLSGREIAQLEAQPRLRDQVFNPLRPSRRRGCNSQSLVAFESGVPLLLTHEQIPYRRADQVSLCASTHMQLWPSCRSLQQIFRRHDQPEPPETDPGRRQSDHSRYG